MADAVLSLGGNVGAVRKTLSRAVGLLCDGQDIRMIARSADYRTPPGAASRNPTSSICA